MEKKIKQLLKLIKLNENTLSMLFGVVTVVLVGVLVFRMYQTNTPKISEKGEMVESSPSSTTMLGEVKVEKKEDGSLVPTELPESYKVEKGDHLWKIAEKVYGSGYNWVDIANANNLKNPSLVAVGLELKLPKVAVKMTANQKEQLQTVKISSSRVIEGESYTVVKGDNLWEIAVRAYANGYRWPEIARANNLKNANIIEVGQELRIPR